MTKSINENIMSNYFEKFKEVIKREKKRKERLEKINNIFKDESDIS